MMGQNRNLLRALTQRGHLQCETIQAVIKVFSKDLLRDCSLDV
jgi:hypothetical protein